MLATAKKATDGLFLYGNKKYKKSILQKDPDLQNPHSPLDPPQNSAKNKPTEELLPLPDHLTWMCGSISLYWFRKISSCSKPQDVKVADDQYNDIAKCRVNQPFIPGYSWVPITHTGGHQTAQKST